MVKICIDPGHKANYNKGIRPYYYEGNMTLDLAKRLKAALEEYDGVQIVMTRTDGRDVALDKRGAMAAGCDLFLSLHSNAAVGDASVHGLTVIRSLKRPASIAFGKSLGAAINAVMGRGYHPAGTDKGVWTRAYPLTKSTDWYWVMREAAKTNCPYIYLIEHGFHTNMTDCTLLDTAKQRQKLAEAEAACIAAQFGLRKKSEMVPLYTFTTGKMTAGDAKKYREALQELQKETGVGFTEAVV